MRIDAHQHYWQPDRGDYGWMPKDSEVLNRAYGEAHLRPSLAAHGIDGTIVVQAAPTVEESEYLLGIADNAETVLGVVGWVDFERPEHREVLRRLGHHPYFLGVRPMIQDLPDDAWMLRRDVQWAFEAVGDAGLTFDALGFPRHLDPFAQLLARHSGLRVVIDHCMKPDIANHSPASFGAWAEGMARLADLGAWCKLSGLVTEAGPDWTAEALEPYVRHVLDTFGPSRVMWGSDWPVCRLAAEYDAWMAAAEALTAHLEPDERAMIFGGSAAAFYGV